MIGDSVRKSRMILDMLATLEGLGNDRMARVDTRLWARHYRRQAVKMGIIFQQITIKTPSTKHTK